MAISRDTIFMSYLRQRGSISNSIADVRILCSELYWSRRKTGYLQITLCIYHLGRLLANLLEGEP